LAGHEERKEEGKVKGKGAKEKKKRRATALIVLPSVESRERRYGGFLPSVDSMERRCREGFFVVFFFSVPAF